MSDGQVQAGIPADFAKLSGLQLLLAAKHGQVPSNGMPSLVGMKILEVEEGRIRCSALPETRHNNPLGTIHGGFTATVLDSAMGCAVHTMLPAGVRYTTLEFKINFIRGMIAGIGEVLAEGRVSHLGTSIAVAEGTLTDRAGKLIASSSTTCMVLRP